MYVSLFSDCLMLFTDYQTLIIVAYFPKNIGFKSELTELYFYQFSAC